MKKRKPIIYATVILSLLFLNFTACKDNPASHQDDRHSIHDQFTDLPDNAEFSHLPTDLSEMLEFGAIGQMRVIPKMHGGYRLLNPYTFPASIPVFAMGDGYIYNIRKEFRTVQDHHAPAELMGVQYDDFSLDMVYSKYAGGHYGHVSALSDEILQHAGEIREGRGVRNEVKIKITAGQVLGFIGPHPGFDIGMYDYERENYFANPSMYSSEYRSTVSYTDYLPASLREEIWAINPRTAEPRGGRVAYDKEETLAGNWFLEGTKELTEWSKQLVFGRHELYGDRITIVDASPLVDGDGMLNDGKESYVWFVKGNHPEPESITIESGMVKYEVASFWLIIDNEDATPGGTVLIHMQEPEKIQYEYFEGKLSGEVSEFTSNSRIYVR